MKRSFLIPVSFLVSSSCFAEIVSPKLNLGVIDVAVIGSGVAGCAAAIQCAHLGLQATMFEGPLPGGLLTETTFVKNWSGMRHVKGMELMQQQRQQAIDAGSQTNSETITAIDCSVWPFILTTSDNAQIQALSVIIATGAHPRMLGVPGEKEYWGRGVSACAVCDAPFYEGKNVFVVGGGDSAIEQATHLSNFAQKVTIVVRKGELRACEHMQEQLKKQANIDVLFNHEIIKVLGDDDGVTRVVAKNNKTGQEQELTVDGVFLALGHIPNSAFCPEQITRNQDGTIVLFDRTQKTSFDGIFAAGDVADAHYRQAACASGAGCAAAIDARDFLYARGLTPGALKKYHEGTK